MRPQEALANVDLFAGMPREVLDELVQRGTTRQVGPGTTLVEQGSPESGLQLVLEGDVDVLVNGEKRASLSEGNYFGEISLIDHAPRSATVVAGSGGARTFAISPLSFAALLDQNPAVARTLLPVLTARLRRAEAALAAANAAG